MFVERFGQAYSFQSDKWPVSLCYCLGWRDYFTVSDLVKLILVKGLRPTSTLLTSPFNSFIS